MRAAGAVAILLWMLILGLAAWPGNVRPAFLDRGHVASVTLLRLFGISAGQPLFQMDPRPWKQHGYCLYVRERAGGALLYPPDGKCRIEGLHLRLPPVDRATHRMLSAAWDLAGQGRPRPEQRAAAEAYLGGIGRAFCRKAGSPAGGLEAVWVWYLRHYDDARVASLTGVHFDYSCSEERLGTVAWNPSDARVLEFWGAPPW